jgi:hypothetical protein
VSHRHVLTGAGLLLALSLAGCAGTLDVDEYPTVDGTQVDCKALLADTPRTVADQDALEVTDRIAAAWGDPPIVLRCGVEDPEALKPTSQCFDVNDVGWLAESTADGYLFTTIGRAFNVSVEVPKAYDPAADALADLAATVKKHDPERKPCV